MKFAKKAYLLSAMFLCATGEVLAQTQQVISGTVSELFGNATEPMMGVNITVVNSQNRSLGGTITNMNGQYNLTIPEGEKNLTIVFSFIGMKQQRVKYTGQKSLNIRMEPNAQAIDDVVVTASRLDRNDMGISNKELISATQKVDMEKLIATTPVTSVEEALQGQLGGVDITLGGDPGTKSAIRIRGISSLNGSNDPLIVIDGVPYSTNTDDFEWSNANEEDLGALLNISPNDIESIEVLKDASATAIWGTQGANGVLMITTKKGRIGKTNFSFTSKWTMNVEPETIPMLNSGEYTSLIQDALWNTANYVGVSNAATYLDKLINLPEINPDRNHPGYIPEYDVDTDWLDLVRHESLTSDNSFSMNGGGEKATYRLSLGWLDEQGTTIGTGLQRFNAAMRIDYQFSDKLKFGANFSYSESNREANWDKNVRGEAFSKMPNKSPYILDDVTGLPTGQYYSRQSLDWEGTFDGKSNYNPVAMVHEATNETASRETRISINADYTILPGFTYRGLVSIKASSSKTTQYLPQSVTGVPWGTDWANMGSNSASESLNIQTENRLMYIKNWNEKHNLIANLVWRTNQSTSSGNVTSAISTASPDLSDPITGTTVFGDRFSSNKSESRSMSGVALVNYTLLDRYVFQASVNMDSNSAMGRNERTGFFPAGGVNWNIQNEPFLAEAKATWLQEAKIRLSVGQSGRAPSGTAYLGAYKAGDDYMGMPGEVPARPQLNNLKWETNTEYNAGLDLSVFDGRLKITADYYKRYTKDLLQRNFKIPNTTGYSSIAYYNSGESTNEGWEFRADAVFYQNKDWTVSGYVNLSRNENVITELPDNMVQESYSFGNGKYAFRNEEGRPIGSFFGYRYKGVYSNKDATYARDAQGNIMNDVNGNPMVMHNGTKVCYPGDAMYEDINYDGVINEYDIVYLGNSQPMVTGGAQLAVKYKNISLSAMFHGRFGQSIVNTARMNNESMYGSDNQSKAVLKRWRREGDVTDIPRALYQEGYNYLGSDRFVEDASFVRLKTLSLSYDFPKNICQRMGINRLNVFATAYNLFTWTDYTGQDPEVNVPNSNTKLAEDSATTPVSRRFSLGLNLSF